MRITNKVLVLIKASPICQAEIALVLNIKMRTVDTYLRDNDERLTTASCLAVISKILGIPQNKIIEKIPA